MYQGDTKMDNKIKLNLGSGENEMEGYINLDAIRGEHIYPLSYPDNSIDEVRASHVLEHFPHGQVLDVLKEWYRIIKPGGSIKIAVPDFEFIAERYVSNQEVNVQGYVSGGQVNEYDFHKCVFDTNGLTAVLQEAGFTHVIRWVSDHNDCSSMSVSLNLQAKKPKQLTFDFSRIQACMSVPRLGFMDNFFSVAQSLLPLRIQVRKQQGVFWGQCITRAFQECMKEPNVKYILAIDYDTVFSKTDVIELLRLAEEYDTDAIAALQVGRGMGPLFTAKKEYAEMTEENGVRKALIPISLLEEEILAVDTMHFGLTLIKVESLLKMAKPWFHSTPDANGEWGDGRVDDDINFWIKWKESGLIAHIAPHVTIGHAELSILWPGENEMMTIHQEPKNYWLNGKPLGVWK